MPIAVDRESGRRFWSYETGTKIEAEPVVSDDRLFLVSGDGKLTAFRINWTNQVQVPRLRSGMDTGRDMPVDVRVGRGVLGDIDGDEAVGGARTPDRTCGGSCQRPPAPSPSARARRAGPPPAMDGSFLGRPPA